MYDDGAGAQHDFCIICYKKLSELTQSVGYMAMGNKDTQHINSFGYCRDHMDDMIERFRQGELSITYFGKGTEQKEPANEALVKWSGRIAYFL